MNNNVNYRPARLVKGHRWYIIYYQTCPKTDKLKRHRETWGLNSIADIKERKVLAEEALSELNQTLIPNGYPHKVSKSDNRGMLVPEGLEMAMELIKMNLRPASLKDYYSKMSLFTRWWQNSKYWNIRLGHITSKHMLEYLDYTVLKRKIGPTTYNNSIRTLSAIFQVLVDRDYIGKNPCQGLKLKRQPKKIRRPLTKKEQAIIYKAADDQMKLCILLTYALAIRPGEIRRLKRHHIDMTNRVIKLPGEITKNKNDNIVVIPDSIFEEFSRLLPTAQPGMYVIGEGMKASYKQVSNNRLNKRHKSILRKLQKSGVLTDITGITFYSWKDTGALEISNQVSVVTMMHHFRHQDLSSTQKYVDKLNPLVSEMRKVNFRLLDVDGTS